MEKCFGFIRSPLESSQSQEIQCLLLLTSKMTLLPFRNCADHYDEVYSSSELDYNPAFCGKSFLVELQPCGRPAWAFVILRALCLRKWSINLSCNTSV